MKIENIRLDKQKVLERKELWEELERKYYQIHPRARRALFGLKVFYKKGDLYVYGILVKKGEVKIGLFCSNGCTYEWLKNWMSEDEILKMRLTKKVKTWKK